MDSRRLIKRGKMACVEHNAPSLRDDGARDRRDGGGEAEEERRCTHCRGRKTGEGGREEEEDTGTGMGFKGWLVWLVRQLGKLENPSEPAI